MERMVYRCRVRGLRGGGYGRGNQHGSGDIGDENRREREVQADIGA
jgi:hypothetical protein